MRKHILKTIQPYFESVWNGQKTFEVRINDRDFQTGDEVILAEYDPKTNTFSGREIHATITYILNGFDPIQKQYVVFSFREYERKYV